MQIHLKEEPGLRVLPKGFPVGYKLPREFFSQIDSRGPLVQGDQATFPADNRTWQCCPCGSGFSDMIDEKVRES